MAKNISITTNSDTNTGKSSKKVKFTNAICKQLAGPSIDSASKQTEYTDTVTSVKFMVSKGGRLRTWFMRYTYNGRKRAIRIGEFPFVTVEEARNKYIEYRAMLERNVDPQAANDVLKAMPTLREFAGGEYLPFAKENKRSANMDESKLRLHILPVLGDKRLCDITRYDLEMYLTKIAKSHSPATRNRHLSLLSRMLNLAVDWDRGLEKNPCNGLKKLRESSNVGRALKPEEITRLQMALKNEPNRLAASALTLLMYSGLRHMEVLTLRWEHVDLEEKQLFLPHTKAGKSRYVSLNEIAIDTLRAIKRVKDCPWVFPGKDPKKPMNNIRKAWVRALAAAKVKHARIHDLRHSFGSAAARAGLSLYTIQHMLGHHSSQTTQKYAHLANGPAMRQASMEAATMLSNNRSGS